MKIRKGVGYFKDILQIFKNIMKTVKLLALSTFLAFCSSPAFSFEANMHTAMIREALSGTLSDNNINTVIAGSNLQEQDETDSAGEPQRHFEATSLKRCCDYVKREQARVISYAGEADKDPSMCYKALFHLGMLLHTVQNFYTNTNYLDLVTADGVLAKEDPYGSNSMLVDWSQLFADAQSEEPQFKIAIETDKSKRTNNLELARGMALRESTRQWNYIEKLIANKFPNRSTDIVSALKKGAVSKPTDGVDD